MIAHRWMLWMMLLLAGPTAARASAPAEDVRDDIGCAATLAGEDAAPVHAPDVERARSSRGRGRSGIRANLAIGGGISLSTTFYDYVNESTYDVEKRGLVTDDETWKYYMLAQPMLDVHLGMEVADEHLVIGLHVMLTGTMERTNGTMIARWEGGETTVVGTADKKTYQAPLALIGLGAHYVIWPDNRWTPLLGLRAGVGLTWDADYRMIGAWDHWYQTGEIDFDKAERFISRIPVRGGLDLGLRYSFNRNLAAELHVPLEMFGMHGYLRGVIFGATLRMAIRL